MNKLVESGLAAVRATHVTQQHVTRATDVSEETIADVVADLMHLAAAAGLDPEDVLAHGRRYYDGDLQDAEPDANLVGEGR